MHARVRTVVLVASLAALAAGLAAAPQQTAGVAVAAKLKNPVPVNAESLAEGEKLFRRRCAGCHGVDAKGGPPKDADDPAASNLVDDKWDHGSTDGEIFSIVQEGIGPAFRMEGFSDRLSETDTWNIINYVRSLAKK
jgi:mono/diheme cytochrome c family protein